MKTMTLEEFKPVFDMWYGTTRQEGETETQMFYRLLTEAEERKGFTTEPTPDRNTRVLKLAEKLLVSQASISREPQPGVVTDFRKEGFGAGVALLALSEGFYAAVDLAFEKGE